MEGTIRCIILFFLSSATGVPAANLDVKRGENKITCLDYNGNQINWSITYKLPKVRESSNPNYRSGSGYAYIIPGSKEWTEFERGIDDAASIIGKTLAPLYQNDSEIAYFLYSDQPPNDPAVGNNGHTKGVIMTNAHGGIWLIHSVPHFPTVVNPRYTYPSTGFSNGQTFLCLTLNVSQVDGIAQVLSLTRPHIYKYLLPPSLLTLLPKMSKIVNSRTRTRTPPWFKLLQLKVYDLDFLIFTKGPKFRKEIYEDWIAPKLQTPLNVQSWLNGPNPLPSNCSIPFPVHNILLKDLEQQNFSTHSDHSKWAVGSMASKPWICIGDLNRMKHQLVRGGAVLCTSNIAIWKLFTSSIKEIQPCMSENTRLPPS